MQDIEFTVEAGRLYLLQTRAAKRSAKAAVAIAVALQREGLISINEALARVTAAQLDALLTPVIEPSALAEATVVASGLAALSRRGRGAWSPTATRPKTLPTTARMSCWPARRPVPTTSAA